MTVFLISNTLAAAATTYEGGDEDLAGVRTRLIASLRWWASTTEAYNGTSECVWWVKKNNECGSW